MNWKQFLKPDRRKIVLTMIITIVWILFLRLLVSTMKYLCKMCPDVCSENFVNYLIVPIPCPCCVSLSQVYSNYLWNLILPLIISYLLSCLIIWIYEKLRKK